MRNSTPKSAAPCDGYSTAIKQCPPARTAEERELQMVALATDLAERQLRAGTASAQVITHFLKVGCMQSELEREKLRLEQELTKAKTASLKSTESLAGMYAEAINALRRYSGNRRDDPDEAYRSV